MKIRTHPNKTTAAGVLRCLLPGALLALVPKCPACFAAWLALATGAGVSLAAAALLRGVLVALCCAVPLVLLGRLLLARRRGG